MCITFTSRVELEETDPADELLGPNMLGSEGNM
jgi:hypothetical protein